MELKKKSDRANFQSPTTPRPKGADTERIEKSAQSVMLNIYYKLPYFFSITRKDLIILKNSNSKMAIFQHKTTHSVASVLPLKANNSTIMSPPNAPMRAVL